jgi:HSP20 family protein
MKRQNLPETTMTETGQSPFFRSLQNEIERVFDRFRSPDLMSASDLFSLSGDRLVPALDVAETDTAVEITAEIPGVEEKDLDISVTDGVLTLKGEKSSDREEKDKDYHMVERRYGSFRRSVPLGFMPDDGKVAATFKDGVLKLRIEKPAESKARTHKIKIEKG